MTNARSRVPIALVAAVLTTSCATGTNGQSNVLKSTFASDDPCSNNARNIGLVGGAVAGVVVAKMLGAKTGVAVAAGAAGLLVGGLVGRDVDRRRCDLYKIAKARNLDIAMVNITMSPGASTPSQTPQPSNLPAQSDSTRQAAKAETVGMSLTIFDRDTQFSVGSATPIPSTAAAFGELADKYHSDPAGKDQAAIQAAAERHKKIRILLVGHTDDTGVSRSNADLSEARARAVARIFAEHGFAESQLFYQGAGEVYPVADNRTEQGRAQNRRVEIIDLSDDAAFNAFLAMRRPNVANYRSEPISPRATLAAAPDATRNAGRANATPRTSSEARKSAGESATPVTASNEGKAPPPPGANVVDSNRKTASVQSSRSTGSVLDNLDFGGHVFDEQHASIDIGRLARPSVFNLIPAAYAAQDSPLGSCVSDHARISNHVKSLETRQSIPTSAYLPGTASSSWGGKANGHLIGLTDVAVLRDGGQPASRPTIYIWRNYADGSKAKPDLKTVGDVNTYQGEKALLYRVFPVDGPLRCIDISILTAAPNTAPSSTFVYARSQSLYQAEFSPTITR